MKPVPAKELRPLRGQIRLMWEEGMDTMDMAKALQLHEALIERELHAMRETRLAIIGSLT